MSIEVLLLGVLLGITCLGYLIAINSYGSTRLLISYMVATLLLAGTVWAIVKHVNTGLDRVQQAEYSRLEREKQEAEERVRTQEEKLMKNKQLMDAAARLNEVVTQGTGFASAMMNVELKNFSLELEVLIGRANEMNTSVLQLSKRYDSLSRESALFNQSGPVIVDALANLAEAAKYYRLYFKSEDAAQESNREQVLRQKARTAYDLFKKAGTLISSSR
ncbi:MAG: hypothetical protein JW795_18255 [Chitinivibrionales bacterium]|nr:hypothetical protein [Chitinivibrionales bacterium]